MKELDLWIFIYNKINRNLKVNLLIVVNSVKSVLEKYSYKMAVSEDIETCGSIGGGLVEFNILNEIRGTLNSTDEVLLIKNIPINQSSDTSLSDNNTSDFSTLIVITITNKYRDIVKSIIDNIEEQQRGILHINNKGLSFEPNKENIEDISIKETSLYEWGYQENIGLLNSIYIIGGGSLGLSLSKIMSTLDFYVVIFDQREDIITMKNNTFANKKIIVNYSKVRDHITESKKSFVVVATPNHDGDFEALNAVISLNLKYIGLAGNKSKSQNTLRMLIKSGFSFEQINKINTVIGLNISPKTPEEIAISIAAEIIKIKNS